MGISIFPELEASAGGLNFEPIASVDLATGTPSTVNFTSIDPKYRALKIILTGPAATAGGATLSAANKIYIRFNADTNNNYTSHWRTLSSGTWSSTSGANDGLHDVIVNGSGGSSQQSFVYYVLDTNTASAKTITGYGVRGNTITDQIILASYRSTSAISAVSVQTSAGTFLTGTLFLLGSV